ncbi:hypothetical protein MKEN_01158400 [Mycena kentingensis (nom. inval.)]|nr:hypothetical protein MKEN_01158400 [Mycena kentingensis (nom. inval.)]
MAHPRLIYKVCACPDTILFTSFPSLPLTPSTIMFSPTLFALLTLSIVVSGSQIQSLSDAFDNAGIQGCIAVESNTDGAPVVIHDCNEDNGDGAVVDWQVSFFTRQPAGPQQIKIYEDKCLDVKDGVDADGTTLQIWTCDANNKNQQWTSQTDWTFTWADTNKCIDLRDGGITDGTPIQLWTCSDGPNQKWVGASNPSNTQSVHITSTVNVSASSPIYCITGSGTTASAAVGLAECSAFQDTYPNGNTTWSVPAPSLTGYINTFVSKCLSVPDSNAANGVKVVLQDCLPRPTNQHWTTKKSAGVGYQYEFEGSGFCLDLTDGKEENGTELQIWECDTTGQNSNQNWWPTT